MWLSMVDHAILGSFFLNVPDDEEAHGAAAHPGMQECWRPTTATQNQGM